jgi:hypothetical protein
MSDALVYLHMPDSDGQQPPGMPARIISGPSCPTVSSTATTTASSPTAQTEPAKPDPKAQQPASARPASGPASPENGPTGRFSGPEGTQGATDPGKPAQNGPAAEGSSSKLREESGTKKTGRAPQRAHSRPTDASQGQERPAHA